MRYRAGFLGLVYAWMVILLPGSDARSVLRRHAAALSCRPMEMTALTRTLIEDSLRCFDKANGKELGTWSPGFPELKYPQNTTGEVQCTLLFIARGLGMVLEDQRFNLNPADVTLHQTFEKTISQVELLAKCVKHSLGGECSLKLSPPKMPVHTFERKQWGHTLLRLARDYLKWLEHKFIALISKVKGTNNIQPRDTEATGQSYLQGSRYLL